MSESDPLPRTWRFYIDDMLEFAQKVLDYTEGYDQAEFERSRLHYDATLRNLELIGEAAMRVPQHVRDFAVEFLGARLSRHAIASFTVIWASITIFFGASFAMIFRPYCIVCARFRTPRTQV